MRYTISKIGPLCEQFANCGNDTCRQATADLFNWRNTEDLEWIRTDLAKTNPAQLQIIEQMVALRRPPVIRPPRKHFGKDAAAAEVIEWYKTEKEKWSKR